MIEQLKDLEKTILEIRKQYHITATELVNLKANTSKVTVKEHNELLQRFKGNQADHESTKKQFVELDNRFQQLAVQNKQVSDEYIQLKHQYNEQQKLIQDQQKQVQKLQAENQALKEKNSIATEHAKSAIEQLRQFL